MHVLVASKETKASDDPAEQAGHESNMRCLETVLTVLQAKGHQVDSIPARDIDSPITEPDLVVVSGGDGTFIAAAHYAYVPMLGINSDPGRSKGYFFAGKEQDFEQLLHTLDEQPRYGLTRIATTIDGIAVPELALNEIFVSDPSPHATTRYQILVDGEWQSYREGGLLVGTAAGSTGRAWKESGKLLELDDPTLQYIVTGRRVQVPVIAEYIRVRSRHHGGRMYIDLRDLSHEFDFGSEALITQGEPLQAVGDLQANRERWMKEQGLL